MAASVTGRILRSTLSIGVVAGLVAVWVSLPHFHLATLVLVLLLAVMITASLWGFLEAAVATILSGLLVSYLLFSLHRWSVEPVERWMVLFTFLSVAFASSYLAARAKRQSVEAVARRREMERLYAFGQDLPIEGSPGSVVAASLDSLVHNFPVEAAAYYDRGTGEVTRSGPKGSTVSEDRLRDAACSSHLLTVGNERSVYARIRSGGQIIGSLAVRGDSMSGSTLQAIAERIEVELEKIRAHEAQRRAEESRKSEELKSAVMDSLVHEIKTPLSVIKTAASSLLSRDSDADIRRELLTVINEEVDSLDTSISQVLWTARIEAGILQSGKSPHDIRQLVNDTLGELKPLLQSRSVKVEVPDSLPLANCDSRMIGGVLKELLSNAVKYSPPQSSLVISVQHAGDEIITSVTDSGAGVGPEERQRIFEKHYRGAVKAPGTGLGLAFAKTIVEAHGGRIGVNSQPGAGSVFHFSLPVSRPDAA